MPNALKRALLALVGAPPENLITGAARGTDLASPLYSALELAVARSPTKRAPMAQWLGSVSNTPGVKPEEIEAYGLRSALDELSGGGSRQIGREDLLDRLAGLRIALREQLAGGPARARLIGEPAEVDAMDRAQAEERLLADYEDEFYALSERYEEGAQKDYYNANWDEWRENNMPNWAVTDRPPGAPEREFPRMVPRDTETGDLFGRNDPEPEEVIAPDEFLRMPGPPGAYYVAEPELRWFDRNSVDQNPWPLINRDRDDLREALEGNLAENERLFWRPTRESYYDYGARGNVDLDAPFATREEAEAALERALASREERLQDQFFESFYESTEAHEAYQRARQEIIDEHIGEYDFNEDGSVGVKWSNYATSGGQDCGELLLMLPRNPLGGSFQSGHWENSPNVLAHARFKTRLDPEGKRTLFVEEIQSDWHQKGREGGYRKNPDDAAIQAAIKANSAASAARDEAFGRLEALVRAQSPERLQRALSPQAFEVLMRGNAAPGVVMNAADQLTGSQLIQVRLPAGPELMEIDAARSAYVRATEAQGETYRRARELQGQGVVPDVPFKDNRWAELMMKRLIRFAAENDYDQIAWSGNLKNGEFYSNKPEGWEFYDKIMVNIANQLGKKSGARVGRGYFGIGGGQEPRIRVREGYSPTIDDLIYNLRHSTEDVSDLPAEVQPLARAQFEAWEAARNANVSDAEFSVLRQAAGRAELRLKHELIPLARGQGNSNVLPLTEDLKNKALYEGFPLFALPAGLAGTEALRRALEERPYERRSAVS